MCKIPPEWTSLPPCVGRVCDCKDDPITAADVRRAGHGASPTPDFAEDPLDGVGGSGPAPVPLRGVAKGEQRFPVPEEAGDGLRGDVPPRPHPLPQGALGGRPAAGLVDQPFPRRMRIHHLHAGICRSVSEEINVSTARFRLYYPPNLSPWERLAAAFIAPTPQKRNLACQARSRAGIGSCGIEEKREKVT